VPPPDTGLRAPGRVRAERYTVRGGAARGVRVRGGDVVTFVDVEGGQRATVVGSSGTTFDVDAGRAGASAAVAAERDEHWVIAAPGSPMAVDAHDPPTPVLVMIERSTPLHRMEAYLPDPLSVADDAGAEQPIEPLRDLLVEARTARSYEVKAGEYIQVVDLFGRQCSDFLAFAAAPLAGGLERGLDATATRTLTGRAIPAPGLLGVFFDADLRPLVEVVRDTVGRHDTFALACTARYYDDAGYPGHANCTDNFNAALASYGISPRAGWPAINFFYSTSFDGAGAMMLDEPWSRPGDYVLLRALTDLVCASSACPDDIDPANGWDPTDIHVRLYRPEHTFMKAMAHRVTPDAEPVLTRPTAFHEPISSLTRKLVDYKGFWLPSSFNGGALDEYWACRERAAIIDLSPLRKFEVLGPDAELLLQRTMTRNIRKLSEGQVVYTAICNEAGGMIDDATVFRFCPDTFRVVAGDEYTGIWLRQQAARLGLHAHVRSSTDQLHNVAVQGPLSRDILRPLIWTAPGRTAFDELTWFRFTVGRIGGREGLPIVLSRTGYSGELGYELWCHPSRGPELWQVLMEAGAPHGMRPLGLDALDMLRIEAGLIFAGYEFDDQIDPFEAGIGFTVALANDDDFVGKAALIERKAHPQRALVGLQLDGNEVAAHGDCVHVGREQVGVITSGARSPVLRSNVALCRMNMPWSAIGTEVEVGKLDGHQKRIPATVVRFPFYDPDKTRPRS
jgi:aminomethyltransferase